MRHRDRLRRGHLDRARSARQPVSRGGAGAPRKSHSRSPSAIMRGRRILEIVDVRWWNASAYYGVELARALRAAGEDVVVAASPESPPLAAARDLGVPVWSDVRFADPNPLRTARDSPGLLRGIRRFDLVDAHRAEGHLLAAVASALAGAARAARRCRSTRRRPGAARPGPRAGARDGRAGARAGRGRVCARTLGRTHAFFLSPGRGEPRAERPDWR
jgi:hypothetical protein